MMNNFLKNGTVLPSGLLTHDKMAMMEGFKKTFQNKTLKAGIVIASYAVTDSNNLSKLFIEYDVLAFEQNEDKGSTVIVYKNCAMAASLGSIADFFEMALRPLEHQTTKGTVPSPSGQDGSIVLLLCLNGMSDTGIIVGSLQHPDRPTTLTTTGPYLQGEYNGINVVVNTDGSTALTFKGATNSYGVPTDSSQGNTSVSISTDGSFSVKHSTITFDMARSGVVTINATGDVNITSATTATVDAPTIKLGASAQHPLVLGDIFKQLFDEHVHPTPIGVSGPPSIPLNPDALSKVSETE